MVQAANTGAYVGGAETARAVGNHLNRVLKPPIKPIDQASPRTPAEQDWIDARIGGAFFLDSTIAMSDAFGGDLIKGLILMAIVRQHMDSLQGGGVALEAASNLPTQPPTADRKPATVYAIAKVLGLNYETTRRHVRRLVEEGYCIRTPGGFVATAEATERPEVMRFVRKLAGNVRRLNARLQRAGA